MFGRGGRTPLAAIGRFCKGAPAEALGVAVPRGRPTALSVPFSPSVGFGGSWAPPVNEGAMSRLDLIALRNQRSQSIIEQEYPGGG